MKYVLHILLIFALTSCQKPAETTADRQTLAAKFEKHARTEILDRWYPQAIDTIDGGFLSTFILNRPVIRTK